MNQSTPATAAALDPHSALAASVCRQALERFARYPGVPAASTAELQRATAAMQVAARAEVPQLIEDARRMPVHLFETLIAAAVVTIATAGQEAINASRSAGGAA